MALAGGINIIAGIHNFIDLGKAGFLSPTGQCKPFDIAADGYCRGEGAGLVVLKKLSQALKEGDQILGVIPGAATNQGGLSSSITVPSSPAQISLYQGILDQAGLRPSQVSYIEAHGTGTQAGDPLEVASIAQVFGGSQRTESISIGSIKGNMGHLELAAGIAGLLKALVMINKSSVPPLASHSQANPKFGDVKTSRLEFSSTLRPWKSNFRVAMINSYGAAGSNAAVLLCQGPHSTQLEASKFNTRESQVYPIVLSASSKESLLLNIASLEDYLKSESPNISVGDVAFTLAEKRPRLNFSWKTKVRSVDELHKSLTTAAGEIQTSQQARKVVLAFSGQTKQIIGLRRAWYDSFPLFRYHIDRCNDIMKQLNSTEILPAIFETESSAIPNIIALQCGTFAIQYACAQSWIDSGLQVDAVVGHSFGELTALVVSGVLSLEDGLKLIAARASLMQNKWGPERGTMLAVHGSADAVRSVLAALPLDGEDVEIACFNAPTNQVVVGSNASIISLENHLKEDARFSGLQCQRLSVSHGFHSRFTDDLLEDLASVADSINFKKPKIRLETCTLEPLDQPTPSHIARHTRRPVYFCEAIQRLEDDLGPCVWLEAGIDSLIIPMVKRALRAPEKHEFEGMKATSEEPSLVMSSITLKLWRKGIDVTFWGFHLPEKLGLRQIWLPPYQFEPTPHWMSFTDHAMEALKNRPAIQNDSSVHERAVEPVELVSQEASMPKNEFAMNLSTKRFVEIVSGHAVLGQPLCPASMYMECALMAVQLSSEPNNDHALWFDNLTFDSPL